MKRNTTARLQSADSQTKRFGIEMLTPTMIILIIMTAYPLIFTLIYSFTDVCDESNPLPVEIKQNIAKFVNQFAHIIARQRCKSDILPYPTGNL